MLNAIPVIGQFLSLAAYLEVAINGVRGAKLENAKNHYEFGLPGIKPKRRQTRVAQT